MYQKLDLGRATCTLTYYLQTANRMATRSIPNNEFYVIITQKIIRVSNFLRILGNYMHAQMVELPGVLFLSPPLSAWVRG